MFHIELIDDKEATKFFLDDPALCYLGLHDYKLVELYEKKSFTRHNGSELLGVFKEDELVLVLSYTYFTDICINIHPYLKSQHQNTEMFSDIQTELRKYFIDNTTINKVICMTPSTCIHIHKACEKFGFVKEGCITNSMTWRQETIDTYIYGLTLKEVI